MFTYYDDSDSLVVGKTKYEMGGIAVDKFVGLQPKMSSILVRDPGEYKKAKYINKNIVSEISHNEYKDFLLNKKYLRHSIKRFYFLT